MNSINYFVECLLSEAHANKPLYHISFRDNLEGVWVPKNPDGIDNPVSEYGEPDMPRISTSPTICQCFQAIYPNISKLFEVERHKSLEFYVYSPVITTKTRVLSPDELTRRRLVHDAHMTDETCILDPVYMGLVMKIRISNTNHNEFLQYHPFGDKKLPEKGFAPGDVKYTVLKKY